MGKGYEKFELIIDRLVNTTGTKYDIGTEKLGLLLMERECERSFYERRASPPDRTKIIDFWRRLGFSEEEIKDVYVTEAELQTNKVVSAILYECVGEEKKARRMALEGLIENLPNLNLVNLDFIRIGRSRVIDEIANELRDYLRKKYTLGESSLDQRLNMVVGKTLAKYTEMKEKAKEEGKDFLEYLVGSIEEKITTTVEEYLEKYLLGSKESPEEVLKKVEEVRDTLKRWSLEGKYLQGINKKIEELNLELTLEGLAALEGDNKEGNKDKEE